MSPSDPTPLAQRLIEACADASRKERVRSLRETDKSASDAQQAACSVVAVLRELAAAEKTFGVGTLLDLADSIEKGAE